MKGKIRLVLPPLIVLLLATGLALSANTLWAADTETGMSVSMPATPVPAVTEIVGDDKATLSPTRFPEFYDASSDNPTCDQKIRALNGQWLWTPSPYTGKKHSNAPASDPGFTPIGGLTKQNFKIPAQYKTTAKLLITWTIRVLGEKPSPWPIWPSLCSPWHGTSYQRFRGGDVETQLYVKASNKSTWEATGAKALMTVPDGGTASISQPRDPTLTGSYVLEPGTFGGTFPDAIDIQIRWHNLTSLNIYSPAKMRNLIITMVPITTQD